MRVMLRAGGARDLGHQVLQLRARHTAGMKDPKFPLAVPCLLHRCRSLTRCLSWCVCSAVRRSSCLRWALRRWRSSPSGCDQSGCRKRSHRICQSQRARVLHDTARCSVILDQLHPSLARRDLLHCVVVSLRPQTQEVVRRTRAYVIGELTMCMIARALGSRSAGSASNTNIQSSHAQFARSTIVL